MPEKTEEKKEEAKKAKPEAKPYDKPELEKTEPKKAEAKAEEKAKPATEEKKAEKKAEEKKPEAEEPVKPIRKPVKENLLVSSEQYLKAGVHIGTRFKTGEMKRFIYKERKDGLKVLNVQTLDQRLRTAATFLSQFNLENIVVVSRKLYGQTPAQLFAEAIGGRALTGRFVPGSFTNPQGKEFIEPEAILVSESDSDYQAIKEASVIKAPVVALVSTNNSLRNVDLAIPINNKGRKSIALAYWLLAKELLKAKGIIKKESEFGKSLEDFEFELKEEKRERPERRFDRRHQKGRGKGKGKGRGRRKR